MPVAVFSIVILLLLAGFTAEFCWLRNLVRQSLRDEDMAIFFRMVQAAIRNLRTNIRIWWALLTSMRPLKGGWQ